MHQQQRAGEIVGCCYNLDPIDFLYVFKRREELPSGEGRRLVLPSPFETYWADDNAPYAPGRTLAEVMYRLLHNPAVFGKSYIHSENGSEPFANVVLEWGGRFGVARERGAGRGNIEMPHFDEIRGALVAAGLDYPTQNKRTYIALLREVLAGRARNPDTALDALLASG